MLKDTSALLLSFLGIGLGVCSLIAYSQYLMSHETIAIEKRSPLSLPQELTPDIILNNIAVKIPSRDNFALSITAQKATIFKQTQSIAFFNISCTSKRNNIFFGSITAQAAAVNQKDLIVTFQEPLTEINLSSYIQQTL